MLMVIPCLPFWPWIHNSTIYKFKFASSVNKSSPPVPSEYTIATPKLMWQHSFCNKKFPIARSRHMVCAWQQLHNWETPRWETAMHHTICHNIGFISLPTNQTCINMKVFCYKTYLKLWKIPDHIGY